MIQEDVSNIFHTFFIDLYIENIRKIQICNTEILED